MMVSRVVTQLPLNTLETERGSAGRLGNRDREQLRQLMRSGPVRFVVADVGNPLKWISLQDCYEFWKSEVQPHVGNPDGADLTDYPGEYCYFATEWSDGAEPIVLLSKAH